MVYLWQWLRLVKNYFITCQQILRQRTITGMSAEVQNDAKLESKISMESQECQNSP